MFPAADDRLTYMLSIEDDSTHEAEESFVVRLSLPDSSFFQRGVQLGTSEATITITDDDGELVRIFINNYRPSTDKCELLFPILNLDPVMHTLSICYTTITFFPMYVYVIIMHRDY